MSSPGTSQNPQTTPPPGLINAAPGATNTTPGQTPAGNSGPGAPVTSYNPAQAEAQKANVTDFTVAPNQTVASQLKDIIASGSPLMQQAEANAKNMMNQRGLINSTMGITAGQSAVLAAATPIATADAATYDRAATNTTHDKNAAGMQDAQLGTATSQYNAGQDNAAMSQAAQASNTVALTAQQIQGSKDIQEVQSTTSKAIAQLQADTSLTIQDKQGAISTWIAELQSNTAITTQDKQSQTQLLIQASQSEVSKYLGELQSSTTLTAQQMSTEAQKAIASANNVSQQVIARIQADTSLSIQQQQTETQKVLAQMNNENAVKVQQMVNAGNLANIQANGEINTKITDITNTNKLLLQNSQGAASLYGQALQNLSNIMQNADMSPEQKNTALNDQVQHLNDGLTVLSQIAGTPGVQSTLTFSMPGVSVAAGSGGGGGQGASAQDGGMINGTTGQVAYTDGGGNQYDANGNYLGTV